MFLAAIMVLSVVAMSAAFAGSAAATNHADLDADQDNLGNVDAWHGEHLVIENVEDNVVIGGDVFDADEDGDAVINTSEIDVGSYTLYIDDEDKGDFTVNDPELDASFSPASDEESTELIVESNLDDAFTDEYNVSIDGENLNNGEELSDEEIEDFLDVDDAENVEINSSTQTIEGNATALDETSDHRFTLTAEFDDVSTSDTANFYSGDADERNLGFDEDEYTATQGDILEFDVNVENYTDAYLIIENIYGEDEYIEITDAGDEDTVTVKLHTYYYGHDEERALSTDDDANVSFDEDQGGMLELDEGERLDTNSYRTLAFTDNDYETRDLEDRTQLEITDRETIDSDSWIAPADLEEHVEEEGPQDLIENHSDELTDSDTVAEGDLVAAEFEANGIFDYAFLNEDGEVATGDDERVAFNEEEIGFSLDSANYHLEVDEEENKFYVVADSSDIADAGEEAELEWMLDNDLGDDDDVLTESFDVEEPTIDVELVEEPYYQVDPNNAYVSGETNLAPGTEIDVEGEYEREFYETGTTTVENDDGTFTFEYVWEDGFDESLLEDGPMENRTPWDITLESDLTETSVEAVFADEPESETENTEDVFLATVEEILGVELDDSDLDTDEMEMLTEALEEQQADISDLEDALETAEDERDTAQNEVNDLNSQIDDLNDEIDQLESDLEDAPTQEEVDDLEDQIATLEDERDTLEDDLEEAESDRDDAQEDLDSINSAIEDAGYDNIDDLISSYEDLEEENEGLQSDLDDANDRIDELEEDEGEDDDGGSDDGTPGFGIAVAITALIGAALLAVRRQN